MNVSLDTLVKKLLGNGCQYISQELSEELLKLVKQNNIILMNMWIGLETLTKVFQVKINLVYRKKCCSHGFWTC